MSDYIIGDVQGCYDSLINLLDKIHFSSDKDRIFFLGDIVNRGPDSLKTLRFIANLEDNANMVIGNHDFHLIACALGSKKQNKKDTFSDILQAKDKHKLIDFLLSKPLVIAENDALLVHAGIPPNWDRNIALSKSLMVQRKLQANNVSEFITDMYSNEPAKWSNDLDEIDDCRYTINALMRMRFCKQDGTLEFKNKGNCNSAPMGYKAWFLHNNRLLNDSDIFFGHWSTLSNINKKHIYPVDSGCVWGGKLSAIRISDKQLYSVNCN